MIEVIGTIIIAVVWAWGFWQSILSIEVIGLGAAGVGLLIITVVAGVSLACIWNWNFD